MYIVEGDCLAVLGLQQGNAVRLRGKAGQRQLDS
jgi:hypothetical protein